MKFTAYSKNTGQVLYGGSADAPAALGSQDTEVLLGVAHANGYIQNGVRYPLPDPPSPHHIFDYTTKQWVDPRTSETEWVQVRALRNQKLRDTDWTQIPDSPFAAQQRQQWAAYRQALRDVTNQSDPFNIVWPVAPGSQS
jgi:hypothetical protein